MKESCVMPRDKRKAVQRTVSVFELTIWAYRRQMVQYEVDRHPDFLPERFRGNLIEELLGKKASISGRGCINGAGTSAALAAHVIHAHVRKLSGAEQVQVISAAAKAKPPKWNPVVPAFQLIPMWKGRGGVLEHVEGKLVARGTFRKMWSKKGAWVGCWLDAKGTPPAIAEAIIEEARRNYRTWRDGLVKLHPGLTADPRLAEFKIEGIGAIKDPWVAK